MVNLDPIQVELIARDAATAALKQFNEQLKQVDNQAKKMKGGMGDLAGALRGFAIQAGLVVGAREIIGFLKEGAEAAADYEEALRSLDMQTKGYADTLLNDLRTASKGTISDLDLLRSANKALAFEISQNQLPELLEAATARAKVMGITTTQAFDDIVTGIARGSPMILDNLGFKGIAGAMEDYAASTGRTVEQLSDFERQQALVNMVIEKSRDLVALQSLEMETQKTTIQQQKAEWENLKREIGEGFTPAMIKGGEALNFLLRTLNDATEGLKRLAIVTSDQEKIVRLADAYQKSGMTFNEFMENAKGKVLEADGSLRAFNKDLDDPNLKVYTAELWGAQMVLGENTKATDRYVIQQRLMNKVLEDGNVTLDEARFLIEQGQASVNDFGDAWVSAQEKISGNEITIAFDTSQLSEAKKQVDQVKDGLQELMGMNDTKGAQLDLLDTILKQGQRAGKQNINVDDMLAQQLGFGSIDELKAFLQQNEIFTTGNGNQINTAGGQRRIEIAQEDLRLEQDRLQAVEKVGTQVAKEAELRSQISMSITAAKDAELKKIDSTTEYFKKVSTEGPAVVAIIKQEADDLERGAKAAERKADAAERELDALEAIALLNDR